MTSDEEVERQIREALEAKAARVRLRDNSEDRPGRDPSGRARREQNSKSRLRRRWGLVVVPAAAALIAGIVILGSGPSSTRQAVHVQSPPTSTKSAPPTTGNTTVHHRSKTSTPTQRCRRVGAVVATTVALGSCGATRHTTARHGAPTTTQPASTTTAPSTAAAPSTIVAASTTVAPSTTVPPRSSRTTAAPTTVAPTTTTTAPPATTACRTDDLKSIWAGSVNGAGGLVFYLVQEENISADPCRTAGYFGVSAYTPAGNPISATPHNNRRLGNPNVVVNIAPGGYAHFQVAFLDQGCNVNVGAVDLIAPNDTVSAQLPVGMSSGHYPLLCGPVFQRGAVESSRGS